MSKPLLQYFHNFFHAFVQCFLLAMTRAAERLSPLSRSVRYQHDALWLKQRSLVVAAASPFVGCVQKELSCDLALLDLVSCSVFLCGGTVNLGKKLFLASLASGSMNKKLWHCSLMEQKLSVH